MKLALAPSGLNAPLRRGVRTARVHGRSTVVVRALLGPYQYKTRVAKLRQKGIQMYEFGERVLQHGSYGDDVMQLQAYLAEQGYLNSADGMSGYFGDATRDALTSWQRHQGLHITGMFGPECKWAVLRQREAVLQAAKTQALVAAVASAPPPLPVSLVQAQPAVAAGILGTAALAAGLALSWPRLVGPEGLAAKAGQQLLRGARLAATAVLGMTVAATRVLYGAASGAVVGAVRAASPAKAPEQRRPAPTPAPAAASSPPPRRRAAPVEQAAAPVQQARRVVPAMDDEEAEEAAYLAAVAASRSSPSGKGRRLSDEEVQQRIAVMKGEVSPRAPAPQRPVPRPLPISQPNSAGDRATGSKYGTYFGGRQVRDKVKQYLEVDTGMPSRGSGFVSRRLESMGFQMGTRPRPRPAKPSPAPAPAQPVAAEPVHADAVHEEPVFVSGGATGFPMPQASREPFRDVVEAVVVETEPKELLSGTELEATPERRGRPVPVVKPGMATPLQLQPGAGSPQAATVAAPQGAPRPVPVVKAQKRATIGDMLRSAARAGEQARDDPYAEPYTLANGGGSGSGSMNVGSSGRRGSAGPSPAAYAQPPATTPGSNPNAPPPAGAFPVNTGSKFAAVGGGAPAQQASAEPTPVQYNPDGSVVLASKPIKLVKPAHLLPKTYGFEQMGVPAAQAEPVKEAMYYAAEYEQSAEREDMFDGYRRHSSH